MNCMLCIDCGALFTSAFNACPADGTPLVHTMELAALQAKDPLVGRLLGERYRVVRRIGTGAHGTVYMAFHEKLAMLVALKLITASPDDEGARRHSWQRLKGVILHENAVHNARVTGHPNVLRVIDAGDFAGLGRYLASELLNGHDVGKPLSGGPLAPRDAARIGVEACQGLSFVHAAGLVHRDVKPSNLFLHDPSPPAEPDSRPREVKIIDFGLACEADAIPFLVGAGTLAYMAPEQFFEVPLTPVADVYGLAATLYHLITGLTPFQEPTLGVSLPGLKNSEAAGQLFSLLTTNPPSPNDLKPETPVSQEMESVIMKALSRCPADRYPDMASFESALRQTDEWRAVTAPSMRPELVVPLDIPLSSSAPTTVVNGHEVRLLRVGRERPAEWAPLGREGPRIIVSSSHIEVDSLHRLDHASRSRLLSRGDNWDATISRYGGGPTHSMNVDTGKPRKGRNLVALDGVGVVSMDASVRAVGVSLAKTDSTALFILPPP